MEILLLLGICFALSQVFSARKSIHDTERDHRDIDRRAASVGDGVYQNAYNRERYGRAR